MQVKMRCLCCHHHSLRCKVNNRFSNHWLRPLAPGITPMLTPVLLSHYVCFRACAGSLPTEGGKWVVGRLLVLLRCLPVMACTHSPCLCRRIAHSLQDTVACLDLACAGVTATSTVPAPIACKATGHCQLIPFCLCRLTAYKCQDTVN